jgi:ATP-binding protein involved in chromosome partitioning
MGILDKRPTALDQTFIPVENHGVKVVSMEMFKQIVKIQLLIAALLLHRVLEQLMSDARIGSP